MNADLVVVMGLVGALLGLLRFVRDWPAARRIQAASAAEAENIVRARDAARTLILFHAAVSSASLTLLESELFGLHSGEGAGATDRENTELTD